MGSSLGLRWSTLALAFGAGLGAACLSPVSCQFKRLSRYASGLASNSMLMAVKVSCALLVASTSGNGSERTFAWVCLGCTLGACRAVFWVFPHTHVIGRSVQTHIPVDGVEAIQ